MDWLINNLDRFLAAWFSLAIMNAVVALMKNRGAWRWLAASLVLGPLVTIAVLFIGARPRPHLPTP